MAKKKSEASMLLQIKVELNDGFRDVQRVLSRINRYNVEIWKETYERQPNKRGEWAYTAVEILVFVEPHHYQPLATCLGKIQGPKITQTWIASL